jgi:hypothetical protein
MSVKSSKADSKRKDPPESPNQPFNASPPFPGYCINPLDRMYYIGNIIGGIWFYLNDFVNQHPDTQQMIEELNEYITRIDSYLCSNSRVKGKSVDDAAAMVRDNIAAYNHFNMGVFNMSSNLPIPLYEIGEVVGSFKTKLKMLFETCEQYRSFFENIINMVNTLDQYITTNPAPPTAPFSMGAIF